MPAVRAAATDDRQHSADSAYTLNQRREVLLLTFITAAGAWLRFWHLGLKSLWLDEGATVTLAQASWERFAWIWWHGEASLQTIYFLFMRGWVHLGASEVWLRVPSALFGIASIPVLYLLARKLFGTAPALAAAALLAFSPTHIAYSQEARSYTLSILLVLVSSYAFVPAVEDDRARDWMLWTVLGIAAFYSHDFTALVLIAQAASIFFAPRPAAWRRLVLCSVVILLAALPGLSYVFRATPENLHFAWMPKPSPREFLHLAMFFGGGGVKVAVAIVLWIAGVVAICRSSDRGFVWRGTLVLLWAAIPPAVLALISLHNPIFLQRYMIFSLPAMLLLAALGMQALSRYRLGPILVVGLCAMSLPTVFNDYHKPREDWRGACRTIVTSAAPGDAVAFFPFYTRIMFDYYGGTAAGQLQVFAPEYYAGGTDVRDLLQALDRDPHAFRHVWVVIVGNSGSLELFEHGATLQKKLETTYGAPQSHRFADIEVLEFGL